MLEPRSSGRCIFAESHAEAEVRRVVTRRRRGGPAVRLCAPQRVHSLEQGSGQYPEK